MRKDFALPEVDTDYLDSTGNPWETVSSDGNWLLIHDFKLPDGYNCDRTSVALRIEGSYPVSQIDMMYFYPHLSRTDAKPIGALVPQQIDNKQWQRWSRHRTPDNPWRPGFDCVMSHIILVNYFLEREFKIR